MKLSHFIFLILIFLLASCERQETNAPEIIITYDETPFDFGSLEMYQSCNAKPRRILSERERCEIGIIKTNCTIMNDCLVTCLNSPDGIKVGGGCYHICGMKHASKFPDGLDKCSSLPGQDEYKFKSSKNSQVKP